MIDKSMWDALWALAPEEMACLCVMTVICAAGLTLCLLALILSALDTGKEDEVWES